MRVSDTTMYQKGWRKTPKLLLREWACQENISCIVRFENARLFPLKTPILDESTFSLFTSFTQCLSK